MRKVVAILFSALFAAALASAQPRALGLRGAWGAELSYEQYMGSENFFEAELGLYGRDVLHVEATYNYIFAGGGTSAGEWNAYWGWGAVVGAYTGNYRGMHVAAAGQIGIEFNFTIPLQFSLDFRPQVGININEDRERSPMYFGYYPAFALRYFF